MLVSRRSDWCTLPPDPAGPAGVEVIRPEGDLDAKMAPGFRRRVMGLAPGTRLVVDLAETAFIDSVGVGLLIGTTRSVTGNGGAVVLAAPRPSVAKVLRATGVDEVVLVAATAGEALALLGAAAVAPSG